MALIIIAQRDGSHQISVYTTYLKNGTLTVTSHDFFGSVLLSQYCSGDKTENRWVERAARMGERRGVFRVLVGNLRERDHFEDPGVDGRIILRWIFRKWDRAGSGQRQVVGTCECDNEPSGCIKCGEFLD